MDDLISRQEAIDALARFVPYAICDESTESYTNGLTDAYNLILQLPSAQPEIIRCKDCIHQEKFFHEDRRRKDGGHYIYGCELADGYSHVCLDDDYCSRSERRTDG